MSLPAEIVARLLGLHDVPIRRLRQLAGLALLLTAVGFLVTFWHGFALFYQRDSQQVVTRVVVPLLDRLKPSPTPDAPQASASPIPRTADTLAG